MKQLHVLVPDSFDDPRLPSGGNTYDRRVCSGLRALGWTVHERRAPGRWPRVDPAARAAVAAALEEIPDGSVVLLDGLVASALPDVLLSEADRLRLVLLMHMPLDQPRERDSVSAVSASVVTSDWSKRWLAQRYGAEEDSVHVVRPGVDPAPLGERTRSGRRLLSVGAVTPVKGQDILVEALTAVRDLAWTCVCVGSLEVDPAFAANVRRLSREARLNDRISFTGALIETELSQAYAAADLLLVTSRAETFGMVVPEALARGVPVVATDVGGLSEALGRAQDGTRPGTLVRPDDPAALALALREWLTEPRERRRLRAAATSRRQTLAGWSQTAEQLSAVLSQIADDGE